MIDYELFSKIKYYREQKGLQATQIAQELGLDARTVTKWLEEERYRPRLSIERSSKLDKYCDSIVRMLETHPYTAVQVFQRITEDGFTGGYTIVKEYVRKVRPRREKAFLTLSFAPGECAQVDWGSYKSVSVGSTRRRLSFFVMVMGYSRMMYVEFTVSQTMEHFLACHVNAFEFFGFVPEKIMVDNLKSAVLKRFVGKAPLFNPKYADFSDHYGFTITPCGVGKGNEKGQVENGVGYVKKNFLSGLDIPDFSAVNPAAWYWRDNTANVRIHGTTKKKPIDLFPEDIAHMYKPMPPYPYDTATVTQARASKQFRIPLDANKYSVPAEYAGAAVTLKIYSDHLSIYHQEKLIARHDRSFDRHKDYEDPDHPKALLAQRRKARDQKIFMRFVALSPRSQEYYRALELRRMNPRNHVRKIVALSEIYGTEPVKRAIDDAFNFQAFSCEYIANLLEQRARFTPEPGVLHLPRREDLLELEVQEPDLDIYDTPKKSLKGEHDD